jgi:hypothetical protein
MLHARPECPDGYYLYYVRAQAKFTTVWLMARVEPKDNEDPLKTVDRKVAMIQEMDEGNTFLAFLTAREGERAMENTDPQELITAVCAVDRMGIQ